MNPTEATLRHVTQALEVHAVPYALVGSVGASAWGLLRMTQDIDLIALAAVDRAHSLVASLANPDIYIPEQEAMNALQSGGSFNVINFESQDKIDVFVVTVDDTFESMRLSRRVAKSVLGVDTWVATPEDIILAKLRWRLDSRSEQQWRDCVELAAINKVDLAYLQQWAAVLGVSEDLEDLVARSNLAW